MPGMGVGLWNFGTAKLHGRQCLKGKGREKKISKHPLSWHSRMGIPF